MRTASVAHLAYVNAGQPLPAATRPSREELRELQQFLL